MPKYKVKARWYVTGHVYLEAEDEDAAEEQAILWEPDEFCNTDYDNGSFEVTDVDEVSPEPEHSAGE